MQAADGRLQSTAGRSLLQSVNSSYPDFEAADTTTSDLTKEGKAAKADQVVAEHIMQLAGLFDLVTFASTAAQLCEPQANLALDHTYTNGYACSHSLLFRTPSASGISYVVQWA